MRYDDFLDQRKAQTSTLGFGREEGVEHAVADRLRESGTVVADRQGANALRAIDVGFDNDGGSRPGRRARLDRVAQQIADRLPQQHIVALHGREVAGDENVALQRARVATKIVGGALGHGTQIDGRQRELGGAGEVEEIRHHFAHRFGLGANAFDVGSKRRGQGIEIEQTAVAVNRGQAVAELVRDAGGQLAHPRQAVLQAELLLECDDGREVREEANGSLHVGRLAEEG